jgi:hypothetical protein
MEHQRSSAADADAFDDADESISSVQAKILIFVCSDRFDFKKLIKKFATFQALKIYLYVTRYQ